MIRAYSVFIEEDLGSRTRLIGRMLLFRYNSENPCFLYGCCSHRRNRPGSTKTRNPESGNGNGNRNGIRNQISMIKIKEFHITQFSTVQREFVLVFLAVPDSVSVSGFRIQCFSAAVTVHL